MTIKAQYKLAYSLLRDPDFSLWDHTTFKIVCEINGIQPLARIAALRSYNQSRLIDEIGESYRNLRSDYAKIHAEVYNGHY